MMFSYGEEISASHIIGGDVKYNLVGYNQDSSLVTYSVQFIIYRDTAGLDFDFLGDFGIFRQEQNKDWESYEVVRGIQIGPIQLINALDDPCKDEILSDLIIETGTYNFNVTLEVGPFNYMVAYQRCCRNYTINNILNPGETGAVYDIIITPEAQLLGNNSPIFKEYPPIFVCLGFDFDFDHSAVDLEGDELVYSLCTPYSSGINPGNNVPAICCDCVKPDPETCLPNFDEVTYIDFYTEEFPVGGDPLIGIDPITGRISGVPNIIGSYVVGVCVEELRDGIVIGSYRRDFEFNVEVCTPRITADLKSDSLIVDTAIHATKAIHSFTTCLSELTIENLSTDVNFIYDYKWLIFDENDALIIMNQGQFIRDNTIALPGPGVYKGFMILNDLDKCVDTSFYKINVLPLVDVNFEAQFDYCTYDVIELVNTSVFGQDQQLRWEWSVNNEVINQELNAEIENPNNGPYSIKLKVIDELDCDDSIEKTVFFDYYMDTIQHVDLVEFLCPGDSLIFEDQVISDIGDYSELFLTANEGCDSLLKTLTVLFYPDPIVIAIDTIICNGTTFKFDNIERSETGKYSTSYSYKGVNCDSVIYQLDLTISEYPILVELDTLLCFGDSIYFQNRWIDQSGDYKEVIKSTTTLCDSFIYSLSLNYSESEFIHLSDTIICYGDSIYFNDQWVFESGLYFQEFFNQTGCDSLQKNLDLIVEDILMIELSHDDSIKPYLDYQLNLFVNTNMPLVEWTPLEGLSCTNCLNPIVNIDQDMTYHVKVTNQLGCTVSEEIRLFVDPLIDFYLPNVITKLAGIDAVNQFFFLHCSPDYSFRYNMFIYDRWGSEVGRFNNINTNVADDGWYAKDFMPGVYVYYIEILDDIEPNVLVGDVTVIR